MENCVSIRVLLVDVGALGVQQADTLRLTEAGGEAQRVFAPVHVPALDITLLLM